MRDIHKGMGRQNPYTYELRELKVKIFQFKKNHRSCARRNKLCKDKVASDFEYQLVYQQECIRESMQLHTVVWGLCFD